MYKAPRQEEEEHYEGRRPLHSVQRRYTNHSLASKRRPTQYYSDEHPEIPKVRRASLYVEQEADQETVRPWPTVRIAQSEMQYPSMLRPSPTKRYKDELAEIEEDEEFISPYSPPPQTTNKIMISPRRRPIVYEPPTTQHRSRISRDPRNARSTRRRHQQPVPVARVAANPLDRSRRTYILVGATVLVLLIVLSTIVNGALNASQQTFLLPGLNINDPGSGKQGSDPHTLVITPVDSDHPSPPVLARAAYLLDAASGATLYAHNPFIHLPILSTTKLMTALIAVEEGKLDQKITINDAITRDIEQLSADSSLMGIKRGETYALRDLLYGLLLVSGNDAAVAIADGLSGSVKAFVDKMNERAKQVGMLDTHFQNPHGLLENGHYSSAHDLALLGKYSMDIQLVREISSAKEYRLPKTGEHKEYVMINSNQFMWWYPGVDGGKPGWDGAKNFVQVISVKRDNRHLIGVTIQTVDWWTDMRNLMNWGFDSFSWTSPRDASLNNTAIPFDYAWNYFEKDQKENTLPTADKGRYFIFTGYSVSDPILSYFDKNEGLKKFGYPTSQAKIQTNTIDQRFERGTIQCTIDAKQCKVV